MLAEGENMKNNKVKTIVFMSLYVALAIVLDYIKEFIPFLNMAAGGSINIALIPVVVASFHLGYSKGVLTGLLWWLLSFVLGLNRYFISVPQYVLDYIIPSGIAGICSLFYKKKKITEAEIGITLMMIIRMISVIISGAIYWPGDLAAGSTAAWIYSLSYNLPYSLLTLIMLLLLVPIILKSLRKYLV